ncbi:MAG TPA: pyruvate kinase [Candidatus Polarisedimenticolia bacterium]|jgi:pyruvate kinase|nr:pyruvate kinase [Candidatus Polarisedimenticolia bacterium]
MPIARRPPRMAKIIATIGPASESIETLSRLLQAGVDVVRLNFSHGTREDHLRRMRRVRRIARGLGKTVGVLVDLPGPKIRTGDLVDGAPIVLAPGTRVVVTTRQVAGRKGLISTRYRHLPRDVARGSRILLDDGNMELEVRRVQGTEILCRVLVGGILSEHKGINLPGTPMAASSPTSKDLADLRFAIDQGADWIALSFVKRARDLVRARTAMERQGRCLPLVAKIERREGVEALDEILAHADGLMVARGDLAVEISPQEVPVLQKRIIRSANHERAVVITATQMLESMMDSPRPTRAEASDVANAVFDGSDAVMLSGETATGRYPVESVRMMDAIIREAEASGLVTAHSAPFDPEKEEDLHAVVHAASQAALDSRAAAVAVYTQTGRTARFLSKQRPACRIIALTFQDSVEREMALYWGVTPVKIRFAHDTDAMLAEGERVMLERGLLSRSDRVIIVSGSTSYPGGTNMMKIHQVGKPAHPVRRRA